MIQTLNGGAGFIHKFVPGSGAGCPTILTLHGTGGNESDLLPLARRISPAAAILSPRGKVLENGMPRFFRRRADGAFDVEDLRARTAELARFVRASSESHGFNRARVVALGYSNGANMAASLLLLSPDVLTGAILLRPMVPIVPEPLPSLKGKRVVILAGRTDGMVLPETSEDLMKLLIRLGADAEIHQVEGGHALTEADSAISIKWFAGHFGESPKR